jgi:hypothetical protein
MQTKAAQTKPQRCEERHDSIAREATGGAQAYDDPDSSPDKSEQLYQDNNKGLHRCRGSRIHINDVSQSRCFTQPTLSAVYTNWTYFC